MGTPYLTIEFGDLFELVPANTKELQKQTNRLPPCFGDLAIIIKPFGENAGIGIFPK